MKNSRGSFTCSGGLPVRSGLKSGKDSLKCMACQDACELNPATYPDCLVGCCNDSSGCDKDKSMCYDQGILKNKPQHI